jgi:hypothetical protein
MCLGHSRWARVETRDSASADAHFHSGLPHIPLPLLPTMVYHRGDDLEDDFMPDETVDLSEDEGFGSLVGDQDDVGTLMSADEEEKAEVKSPSEGTKVPSEEKKRKRREKEKKRKEKECPLHSNLVAG